MHRRLKFSLIVLISQILLMALGVSWLIHMILIEVHGAVYFVEKNPAILWIEIASTAIIVLFAGIVLILQIKRISEKRKNDPRQADGIGQIGRK